jgi:hypothetical protein
MYCMQMKLVSEHGDGLFLQVWKVAEDVPCVCVRERERKERGKVRGREREIERSERDREIVRE